MNGRVLYVVVLALCVALSVMYLERRELLERYETLKQSETEIGAAEEKIRALEEALAQEQRAADGMEENPLEVEAAIRRIKRGIRDNETVYHVEGTAPAAEPRATAVSEEDRS